MAWTEDTSLGRERGRQQEARGPCLDFSCLLEKGLCSGLGHCSPTFFPGWARLGFLPGIPAQPWSSAHSPHFPLPFAVPRLWCVPQKRHTREVTLR